MAQWQVATATAQRIFLRKQCNSYGTYVLRNSYGIFVTRTVKRQQQNGNGMVETRHHPGLPRKRPLIQFVYV